MDVVLIEDRNIQNPSTEFCWTDGLLLVSIEYCNRFNYPATLAQILFTADSIDRAYPFRQELEDGLNRLLAAHYMTIDADIFRVSDAGREIVEWAHGPGLPTKNISMALRDLEQRLKQGTTLQSLPREVNIGEEDYKSALREMREIGLQLTRKAYGKP